MMALTKRSWISCLVLLTTAIAFAQHDRPAPSKPSEVVTPALGGQMTAEYAKTVAAQAYVWGWPLVNMMNRRSTLTQAPQPGHLNGILPVAPMGHLSMLSDYITPSERAVACPNQDVVYGQGWMNLDKEALVIQVPDFGDRFWVYAMYDGRSDQFSKMGKPYGTKPGFYLITGPNWKGTAPQGIAGVIRSSTDLGLVLPRVFQDDTPVDRTAIQPVINQIVMYPLSQFDGKMKTLEWTKAPSIRGPQSSGGETKWVVPEKFFEQFAEVLKGVPPLPGEESMYSNFHALLDAAAKDPKIKKVLTETAVATEKNVIQNFLQWRYNGLPAGNNWNRSVNNAAWGYDYLNRSSTARSNIFENIAEETQYFYTDFDASNKELNGNSLYEIRFAPGQEPPVQGFWSLTLYNKEHFFHPNSLKRYSLGTKNKALRRNSDGSLSLYAGAKSPGKDLESNWLPAPRERFSLYIRAYWGKEDVLNGNWKPPMIRKVQSGQQLSMNKVR